MNTVASTVLAAGALIFAAGPAFAVSVTNNAEKSHEVTVDLGDKENRTNVDAGKTVKLDCPDGCELRVSGSGYGLAATNDGKAVITKNGMLAYADQNLDHQARHEDGKSPKTMAD